MNLSRVNDSPEVYSLTESRTIRGSQRWATSGTKSGECVSIFPDGTRIPFVSTRTRTKNVAGIVRRTGTARGMDYETRLKMFGAIGNGESD